MSQRSPMMGYIQVQPVDGGYQWVIFVLSIEKIERAKIVSGRIYNLAEDAWREAHLLDKTLSNQAVGHKRKPRFGGNSGEYRMSPGLSCHVRTEYDVSHGERYDC